MERPKTTIISKVQKEAEGVSTIFLKANLSAKPGQFIMAWIPRMDEKPFAISYLKKGETGITVAAVGPFSNKISALKPGDKAGLRGPYGTGYTLLKDKTVVMIGGGYGSASLTLLAEQAAQNGCNIWFILGARSKERLVFEARIKKLVGERLIITTDDGSKGKKGFVTDALKEILSKEKIDMIYACGPDRMLKAITDIGIASKVPGEISMERYFKCGFGICGHCCVDPLGIRLCVEGPVLNFETAAKISELGAYHRVKSSRKERL